MSIFLLVYVHLICAIISLLLLLIRGVMQLSDKNWRAIKLLKILPHLSDTLLILSGMGIIAMFGFHVPPWGLIKIALLILYIIFAAKFFGKNSIQPKSTHFILALVSFALAGLVGFFH
ncbi:hypothetical protein CFY87_01590 [Actinobacillus seminis]|uniref:Invasion gene expression up-regulator SirB n=1 Tax=Actinobacillus seminis TaxID=722 RepID=A0A263HFL9_9PAST|nr:SirB2 family protein [Actinobacillus seminis]OZN25921.1 hypothetical protein CFY87_01590 [Actinobacillus seminis]SUU34531.1 invasion gene expression up-regulator SirB [Actinobacillus seminis]